MSNALTEILISRAEVVRIHLDRLECLLRTANPSPGEAVYASIALRFLFDGHALWQVAQVFGISLMVFAPDLDGVPIDQALFFAAGGYRLGAHAVASHFSYREPGPNSPHRPQFERQVAASPRTPAMREVKFTRYGSLPCLALFGEVLSREELVRYVANKCGGAHHHDDSTKFKAVDHRLTQVGQALRIESQGLSAVFLETLGTAWFLLSSPTVQQLRKVLASN